MLNTLNCLVISGISSNFALPTGNYDILFKLKQLNLFQMKQNNYTYYISTNKRSMRVSNDKLLFHDIRVHLTPYEMNMDELDTDDLIDNRELFDEEGYPIWNEDEKIIFYDGYAINTSQNLLLVYKTIEDLCNSCRPNWAAMDASFYNDGNVNFFQIQYITLKKQIVGKKKVARYLAKHPDMRAQED